MSTAAAGRATLAVMREALKRTSSWSGVRKCQVAEGEPGRILIGGFVVGEEHLNRHGKFHGGVSATLVDAVSSLSAVSPECPQVAWVSADLNISYLSTAALGDELVLEGKVIGREGRLIFVEAEVRRRDDGVVVARGSQRMFAFA